MKKSLVIATLVGPIWLGSVFPVSGEVADSISYPVSGSIVQDFGGARKHLGEDLRAAVNDPVYAPCNANIFNSGIHRGYGGAVVAQFTRPDGEQDVWLVGHMFTSSLRGTGHVNKGEVIGTVADRANNGGWDPHIHFAVRKGPHPGSWVYPGYAGNNSQTMANFYDPSDYITNYPGGSGGGGGGGGSTTDTTPPTVVTSECRLDNSGGGKYKATIKYADSEANASGYNSGYMQIEGPYGGRHGIGGQNWSNPIVLDIDMNGRTRGVWKVLTWGKDNAGNACALTDTGLRINWGAPWLADKRVDLSGNAFWNLWFKFDGVGGYSSISWNEICLINTDKSYRLLNGRNSGNEAHVTVDALGLGLVAADYPIKAIVVDNAGNKADMIDLGTVLTVPTEIIPAENLSTPLVTPPNFTQWSHDIAVASMTAPTTPMQNRIPLSVELGGGNIANLDHWCVLVYGNNGNAGSYKTPSGHETGRTISCVVDTNGLPSGWLTVGALFYLKGNSRDGYEIHSYGRIKVDKDHPTFDKIISGPNNGSTLSIGQMGALCLRAAFQDLGGSGTDEFRLALEGQGELRGFTERVYGYQGLLHCNLQGLKPGVYNLVSTYAKDKVGNETTATKPTGISYTVVQ